MIELYRNTIWQLQKHFVKRPVRCKNCIANEAYAYIDQKTSLCHFCLSNKSIELPNLDLQNTIHLDDTLHKSKRILFMFSGGKDSSYILSRMCETIDGFQDKVVCLFVDNTQTNPNALKNTQKITDKLNCDLWIVKNKRPVFEKLFYEAINNLDEYRGLYHTVDRLDGDTIFGIADNIAKEYNFDIIVSGLSWSQLRFIIGTNNYIFHRDSGIGFINPLAVWQTKETVINNHLNSRGLIKAGKTNPLATNNQLIVPLTVLDIKKFGYSTFEPEFVNMIRAGQLDKELWRDIFDILIMFTKLGLMNGVLKQKKEEICQTKRK